MTTLLPERPDLGQLKRQAKDLFKAHQHGDASVCAVLRQLHRFDGSPDTDILTSDLKLHEVQFAIALDYGFSSWDALKHHIERIPSAKPIVHRENGEVWIDGIPKLDWSNPGECTFIGALLRALNRIGEPINYIDLMGLSGASFRFCFAHPNWDFSSVDGMLDHDHGQVAMDALGYEVSWAEGESEMRDAFKKSIDDGRPALGIDLAVAPEWGVIAGYADEGKTLLCRTYFDGPGDDYARTERIPWLNYIIGARKPAPTRRESFLASLGVAVTVAHAEGFTSFGGGVYKRGLEGLSIWASDLAEESRFDSSNPDLLRRHKEINQFIYDSLVDARTTAAQYVRRHSEVLGNGFRERLLRLASLYDEIVAELQGCKQHIPRDEDPKTRAWTLEMRQEQIEMLGAVLALERQAIGSIEEILARKSEAI